MRHAGRLYHIGTGRTSVLLLAQDLHIRVINAATGELLHELTLDTTHSYQPTGRPPRSAPRHDSRSRSIGLSVHCLRCLYELRPGQIAS